MNISMKKRLVEGILVLASIFTLSYLLNFVWESLHSVLLYAGHDFNAKRYVLMVTVVSGADASLIVGIYLMVSLLWRNALWLRMFAGKQIVTSALIGVVLALAIEYRHMTVLKTWTYGPLMPTLFGIGISPLIQLSTTGIIAFWFTRRMLYIRGRYCEEYVHSHRETLPASVMEK